MKNIFYVNSFLKFFVQVFISNNREISQVVKLKILILYAKHN